MGLTYSLRNAPDLYGKLQRDAASLEEMVNGDRVFNLLITAYHLQEWIDKDPDVPIFVRTRLGEVRSHPRMMLCADLANASKHFVQRRKGEAREVSSTQGLGVGRFGKGLFGHGEESVVVQLTDGSSLDVLELCDAVMKLYTYVFDGALAGEQRPAT